MLYKYTKFYRNNQVLTTIKHPPAAYFLQNTRHREADAVLRHCEADALLRHCEAWNKPWQSTAVLCRPEHSEGSRGLYEG